MNHESEDDGHAEGPDAMSDEKFDHWLQSAVGEYNRPPDALPAAPRAAMWGAIEGALHAARAAAPATSHATAPAGATVVPIARRRVMMRYWQGAAAVAILAAGVGIGRLWSARQATSPDAPSLASAPAGPDASPSAQLPARDVSSSSGRTPSATPGSRATPDGGAIYDVAAVQHLSRAEALLTAFRANRDGSMEAPASMNRWARDLLVDTRLLLDSPAASDAQRRHLLEDLELVLAQIVQLPAESSADRGLVQRSIERGAVLSRLRSTIPAGYTSGT
ncbi:MAG: hypothetical protein IT359_08275 [Gemmatimonadaceae bacterium]|nr:hypothetical protein [Gemmatimonadaceae bacterium]